MKLRELDCDGVVARMFDKREYLISGFILRGKGACEN
jgi:hypothetical protein